MKTFIKLTGLFFLMLIAAGLLARVIMAARTGKGFYGENYYGQPLGTYSTLIVLAVIAAVVIIIGVRWLYAHIKRIINDR